MNSLVLPFWFSEETWWSQGKVPFSHFAHGVTLCLSDGWFVVRSVLIISSHSHRYFVHACFEFRMKVRNLVLKDFTYSIIYLDELFRQHFISKLFVLGQS